MKTAQRFGSFLALLTPLVALWTLEPDEARGAQDSASVETQAPEQEDGIRVEFLEVVTPDADATCALFEELHGVTFSDPRAEIGGGRTATLSGGGRISVRPPMHDAEDPVVRPYMLVDDIEVAIEVAEAAGGVFAMLATEIPGEGKFAIYFLGGIQHGLWER